MENFTVSARKYRPITFDSVVGQNTITNTLKNAIKNNQLAQAFLFCGPRGVGKTTCARILAKTINCENLSENAEACNECEPCKSFNVFNSFNFHELDAASNNSVDDIRSLNEQVRIPPQNSKYKVYIIDEVHMLSTSAFNAFLKTLEEPPPYVIFILATTEKHKVIPTILSRCQIFDFNRIKNIDIVKHLQSIAAKENVNTEERALNIIAQKADGGLRDALSLYDVLVNTCNGNLTYNSVIENLNIIGYEYYFEMTSYLYESNIFDSITSINNIVEKGFEGNDFIIGLGEHFRSLLVAKHKETIKLLHVDDELKKLYLEQSSNCDTNFLIKAIELCNKCDYQYKTTNNKALLIELTLMQIASITNAEQTTVDTKKPFVISADIAKTKSNSLESVQKMETKVNVVENKTIAPPAAKDIPNADNSNKYSIVSPNKSVTEMLNSDKDSQKKTKVETVAPKVELNNPFNQTDLDRAWQKVKENFAANVSLFVIVDKIAPLLDENMTIKIIVDSQFKVESVKENYQEIFRIMKDELKNSQFKFDFVIDKVEYEKKPYTQKEKYEKMKEINPNVENFVTKLGLTLDF